MKRLLTVVLLLSIAAGSLAQSDEKKDAWTVGLHFGPTEYKGDIGNEFFTFSDVRLAGGVSLNKYLNPSFDFMGLLYTGKMDFDDGVNSFETRLIDLNLLAKYKFNNGYLLKEDSKVAPFVFAGLGDAIATGPHFTNRADVNFNFPIGWGLSWQMTDNFGLMYNSAYHYSTSDDYDGVATTLATGNVNDQYFFHSLGAIVNPSGFFGKKDKDGDGVKDKEDRCPDEKGIVALKGCPDSDGDGFADKVDQCPKIAGTYKGCPDRDKDKVPDSKDKCPDQAGYPEDDGCPDGDGDGVPDHEDACPNAKGTVDMKGCPDRDNDGFADKFDSCPDKPGKSNGCPDSDGDGLSDDVDQCPDQAGPREKEGCPDGDVAQTKPAKPAPKPAPVKEDKPKVEEVKKDPPKKDEPKREEAIPTMPSKEPGSLESLSSTVLKALEDYPLTKSDMREISKIANNVFFETGSYTLTPATREKLDLQADILKRNPNMKLSIEGHTDSQGEEKNNASLSEKRAISVQGYLTGKGVAADRLTIKAFGESTPIEPNNTPENMKDNRRVTLNPY